MLDLARLDPETARRRWQWLLDTDGGQVEWDEDSQTFRRLTLRTATQHVGWPLTHTELRQAYLLLWRSLARRNLTDVEQLLVDSALWHCRGVLGVGPTDHYHLPAFPGPARRLLMPDRSELDDRSLHCIPQPRACLALRVDHEG